MSDRMTNASWKCYRTDFYWTERDRVVITAELDRARQAEEDLAETIKEKDAEIARLRDELAKTG